MQDLETGWYFPPADLDGAGGSLRPLFSSAEKELGFVPNVFRAYGYRPERFSAWFAHYRQLHQPTENLTAADREMVAVVVSSLNRCTYCVVSHSASLREHLGDAAMADRIAVNWRHAGLTEKHRVICEFAEVLTVAPHTVSLADLERLESVGLTRDEVWDVAEIGAMYAFTNRLALATGQMPNDEYYEHGRCGCGSPHTASTNGASR
ncbi:MAG: peroxidase-related enzyme [Pseudonocardia sp.]